MRYWLPWVFGGAFTGVVWVIGAYAATIATVTCLRTEPGQLQGYCQLRESTVFRPWAIRTVQVSLHQIRRATVVEEGAESYAVLLVRDQDTPPLTLLRSPYQSSQMAIATQINTFLRDPAIPSMTVQIGGGIRDTVILISFLSFGPLFAGGWASLSRCKRSSGPLS